MRRSLYYFSIRTQELSHTYHVSLFLLPSVWSPSPNQKKRRRKNSSSLLSSLLCYPPLFHHVFPAWSSIPLAFVLAFNSTSLSLLLLLLLLGAAPHRSPSSVLSPSAPLLTPSFLFPLLLLLSPSFFFFFLFCFRSSCVVVSSSTSPSSLLPWIHAFHVGALLSILP